jgi:hypothetical protein
MEVSPHCCQSCHQELKRSQHTYKNTTQDTFEDAKRDSVPRAAYNNHANKIDLNTASTCLDDGPEPPTPSDDAYDEDEIIHISSDDED